ncbi:MAG TPA: hypothetical protein VJK05_05470 [archaeon]|nr:hypothetical protein [archaeon]
MERVTWDKVFLDSNYLKIMYYLAKYNPSIEAKEIAEKFNTNPKNIEEKLVKLAHLKIVDYNQDSGYTLTDRGLMSLYNFHSNFNSTEA